MTASGGPTPGARPDGGRRTAGGGEVVPGGGAEGERRPHGRSRARPAWPRPGPARRCLLAQAPSILTPPPASRRHSPNRNRLLSEGVSGRARNAKLGNRREPEPPPQHRKSRRAAAEAGSRGVAGGGGRAEGQRAELRTYGTPAQCGEAREAKEASKAVDKIFLFPFHFGPFFVFVFGILLARLSSFAFLCSLEPLTRRLLVPLGHFCLVSGFYGIR